MTSKANPDVKNKILGLLEKQGRMRPTELLDALDQEFDYQQIQDSIMELLNDHLVELASDRHLSKINEAAA